MARADALNCGGWPWQDERHLHGVPATTLVEAKHPAFCYWDHKERLKLGSFQEFVRHDMVRRKKQEVTTLLLEGLVFGAASSYHGERRRLARELVCREDGGAGGVLFFFVCMCVYARARVVMRRNIEP